MDWKVVVDKIFSGRYFLTIVAGIVFAYASVAKIINAEVIGAIVTMVFTLYFTKPTNGGSK
jgi:hypothetical protein